MEQEVQLATQFNSWCYLFLNQFLQDIASYRQPCFMQADTLMYKLFSQSVSRAATFGTIGLLDVCLCLNSVTLMVCQVWAASSTWLWRYRNIWWPWQSIASKVKNLSHFDAADSELMNATGISSELLNHFLLHLILASAHTGAYEWTSRYGCRLIYVHAK